MGNGGDVALSWKEMSTSQPIPDGSGTIHPAGQWIDQTVLSPNSSVFANWNARPKNQPEYTVELFDTPGFASPLYNVITTSDVFDLQVKARFTNPDATGMEVQVTLHFEVAKGQFVAKASSFKTNIISF